MRLFVLGGSGFVGSAVVRAARRRGLRVTAITRENYPRHVGRRCDLLVNANGNSRKYLAERDPLADFDASVTSVLRSLVDFPCDRYVYLGSVDVYPRADRPRFSRETARIDPGRLSRYGLHKHLAEQLVQRYAARWFIARLGGMVGPGLWKNPIYDILHDRPLHVDVDSCYQYIGTDAVAEIVLDALERQPRDGILNVCGRGSIALREVLPLVPTYRLRYAEERPRRERFEVDTGRLAAWCRVPETQATVREFIRRHRLGS